MQVATTCLFLASKVEETPKKLRDVVVETYKVQHSTVAPPESDQELWKLKEQVLICERELLRVLGFDLSVEHAYRCVCVLRQHGHPTLPLRPSYACACVFFGASNHSGRLILWPARQWRWVRRDRGLGGSA